ncbi:MAG: hypothetical protein AAB520_03355 [Patescibacteria group bacterium]
MNKNIIVIIAILLLGIGGYLFITFQKKDNAKKIHYHAGFVVFNNNKQINFSGFKYMVIKPCNLDNKKEEESDEDDQMEKAHLHDQIGDVVHVERENAKWVDLFTNLKYKVDYSKATAYLNGKKLDNFRELVIQPYDNLVVLIGSKDTNQALKKAVTVAHVKQVEKRSENCGT